MAVEHAEQRGTLNSDDILTIAWAVMAVLLSSAEIVVPGFFLLPFGLGAGAAAIAALVGATFIVQLVVFIIVSVALFAAMRPIARRLNQSRDPAGVGANRLLNQRGVVIDSIGPDDPGLVRVDREDWRAESADESALAVGTRVVVVDVKGTRVFVTPAPPEGTTL